MRQMALQDDLAGRPPVGLARRAEMAVQLDAVTQSYASLTDGAPLHALGPIDLELERGSFFSVIGPSGCGKSTLINIVAGLTTASSGGVRFEGKPIHGEPPEGVGMVFQEDSSFPWLTVFDNVAFGLRRQNVGKGEIKERVDAALAFTGLAQFAQSYPSQLSGGMRQRVCIARTMVLQPRLILLDEPFGALDQQTRLLMGDELLRLWRKTEATVILITHSLDEAAMLSDRVGVMSARPGRFIEVIETGWPRERTSEIVSDSHFGALSAHMWSLLRGESLKAMQPR